MHRWLKGAAWWGGLVAGIGQKVAGRAYRRRRHGVQQMLWCFARAEPWGCTNSKIRLRERITNGSGDALSKPES